MAPTTTPLHRVLLGLSAVLLGGLGVLYVVAPGIMLDRLDITATGGLLAMLRVAGSAVLAETVAVVLALRSRQRAVVAVVSWMLVVHFGVETVVRIGSYVAGESTTIVTAVPQAILAVGLAVELARAASRQEAAHRPTGARVSG